MITYDEALRLARMFGVAVRYGDTATIDTTNALLTRYIAQLSEDEIDEQLTALLLAACEIKNERATNEKGKTEVVF